MSSPTQRMTLEEIEVQLALGSLSGEHLPDVASSLYSEREIERFTSYLLSNARRKGLPLHVRDVVRTIRAILTNPVTPVTAIITAASHKSIKVRSAVAKCPRTPEKILEHLSEDRNDAVRHAVALNPRVAPRLLEKLYSYDNNADSSIAALSNLRATSQMLADAVNRGTMRHVQVISSYHPGLLTTPGIIEILFQRAMEHILPDTSFAGAMNAIAHIVYQTNRCAIPIKAETIRQYSSHPNRELRCILAGSDYAPQEVLLDYLRDSEIKVRCKAVRSGKIPLRALRLRFLCEKSQKVKHAIAGQITEQMAKGIKDGQIPALP